MGFWDVGFDTMITLVAAAATILIAYVSYRVMKQSKEQSEKMFEFEKMRNRPYLELKEFEISKRYCYDPTGEPPEVKIHMIFENVGGKDAVVLNHSVGLGFKVYPEIPFRTKGKRIIPTGAVTILSSPLFEIYRQCEVWVAYAREEFDEPRDLAFYEDRFLIEEEITDTFDRDWTKKTFKIKRIANI